MKRRNILVVNATALVVAAAFTAPSPVVAADTSVQFYGHLDLSIDDATKGIKEGGAGQNPAPVGKVGWQADVDNKVLGALGSRNSYLGIAGGFGALKLGKTDAPYKLSTARMDPFSATVGDYNSIMGNSGGDNRAEF